MIYFLFLLFVLLQVLDWWTTTVILRSGGRELNPVLLSAFRRFGVQPTLISYKLLITVGCGYLAYDESTLILIGLCLLYVLVVGNNALQLYRR